MDVELVPGMKDWLHSAHGLDVELDPEIECLLHLALIEADFLKKFNLLRASVSPQCIVPCYKAKLPANRVVKVFPKQEKGQNIPQIA